VAVQGFGDDDLERKVEQLYFDTALEHRERRRELIRYIPEGVGHKGDARDAEWQNVTNRRAEALDRLEEGRYLCLEARGDSP
jgi:hypothetical protein